MPFALPEYDEAFALFLHTTVRELARARSPVLSQIEFVEESTTAGSRIRSREGVDVDLPESKAGFELTTPLEAVRTADFDVLATELDQAAENLVGDLMGLFVSTMDTVTQATGNVVDAKGELTFEKIYELLDRMEWGLTDEGELSIPSLVLHPDMVSKLPPETPKTLAAMEELKQRKYEEALARRGSRRLS